MDQVFATLLIPAQIGVLPATEHRIVRMEAVAMGGQRMADVTVADTGIVHVAPADGGPVLAISLVAVANACLKASGARHRDGAA